MKKLFLIVLGVFGLYSCEDVQENSPAFQAEIDNVLFKSLGSAATVNGDTTITIQASNSDETLTLYLDGVREGNFLLGESKVSFAAFEALNGTMYSTQERGDGFVTVSEILQDKSISGSFQFMAASSENDSIFVQRGVFFEVPFTPEEIVLPEDPDEPDPNPTAGTLVARVDGAVFNAEIVQGVIQGETIVIQGNLDNATIELGVPIAVAPSSVTLPSPGYIANYVLDGMSEAAIQGNIQIFEHDMVANTIKGVFSFATKNHAVSQGQFNIRYQ